MNNKWTNQIFYREKWIKTIIFILIIIFSMRKLCRKREKYSILIVLN